MSRQTASTDERIPSVRPDTRTRLAVVAVAAIAVDVASKSAAVRWLTEPFDLGWITLRVIRNTGVAFGVGADWPVGVILVITGVVSIVLVVAAWRGDLGGPIPAGLIVGGGLANLVDRALGGGVIDMLDVGRWPVFNLADVWLTLGIVGLVLTAGGVERPTNVEGSDAVDATTTRSR